MKDCHSRVLIALFFLIAFGTNGSQQNVLNICPIRFCICFDPPVHRGLYTINPVEPRHHLDRVLSCRKPIPQSMQCHNGIREVNVVHLFPCIFDTRPNRIVRCIVVQNDILSNIFFGKSVHWSKPQLLHEFKRSRSEMFAVITPSDHVPVLIKCQRDFNVRKCFGIG